ncbi:Pex12 amino terminal region-domain-containing protein [Daldinia caldariorum]|uniref:Pex12 amino terminal region-domain-containing protein n=1 Tax=Daldinia caldariorum TaxID=326644 RepID=UPI0020088C1C|nr:Pex12 amino terminal region-domain-containing protein [Daldinia caldariorum]KAI1465777.1 Pex12 amino terminal region-domain-containing protein [Daldinia caldariorum]
MATETAPPPSNIPPTSSSSSSPPSPPSSSSPSASTSTTTTTTSSSPYPYAFAPDIIRAHQKDAYFQGLLTNQLSELHRRLLGARSAHAWASESRTLADLLYLSLTTLVGNRTLGEEYCGLVQVESPSGALPSLRRRAAYIAGSILAPYALSRFLPKIRARIRARLQRNLGLQPGDGNGTAEEVSAKLKTQKHQHRKTISWSYKLQAYLLTHLTSLTSPSHVHAVSLALFYFGGSYYELAKRLAGLRYVFTRKAPSPESSSDRAAGYELLGVLLAVQMAVQAYLHVRAALASASDAPDTAAALEATSSSVERPRSGGILAVSLDNNAYSSNNELLLATAAGSAQGGGAGGTRIDILAATHTPPPPGGPSNPRYDLADDRGMRWIKGTQQRKCTLCLEELKDPSATPCGHVFCWACIGDWVREKPECPLCRREALVQHILPLQAV